ncbi:Mitotic spindle-associated MMXD complex subunit MIP18, partial [Stegodyphus mimosarum]
MTLEELGVVDLQDIKVKENNYCFVEFKPTIPHCSMATLIGLSIKVQLLRILPAHFKVDVCIAPGTHVSFNAINKQLADKERIAAALENYHLLEVINSCLLLPEPQTIPDFVEDALKDKQNADVSNIRYIQHSRQHIESFRRWHDVLNKDSQKSKCFNLSGKDILL